MHRGSVVVVLLVALIAAGCSSSSGDADRAGPCDVRPGVVCKDQDLRNVSMVSADLTGADFSGTDLRGSDLRGVNLTDAKLVGTLLGGVNLSGASLKNANLTKANLFFTNLTDVDMSGAIETGIYACNVTQPNGALVEGDCPSTSNGLLVAPTGKQPTAAPVIDSFKLAPPARCLNDAAGQGIDVDYITRNVTSLTFSVDSVRIEGATKARGTQRLPFICNGKPHTVTLQAFGPVQPTTATMSFTTALGAALPSR